MGLRDITGYWLAGILPDISGQQPVTTRPGEWSLPEAGCVRLVGGDDNAWVEVFHTAAVDVTASEQVSEALATASIDSPVTAVLIDDAVVARHVMHAHDLSEAAVRRAVSGTYWLASSLCEQIVDQLQLGTCAADVAGAMETAGSGADSVRRPAASHDTERTPQARQASESTAIVGDHVAVPAAGYL